MGNDMPREIWVDVLDYEGLYWVSNLGRIKSKRCVLKKAYNPKGYLKVALSKNVKPKNRTTHSIVLEAFVERRPEGMVARHLDGNKVNNFPENLKWGTLSENQQDRKLHGTYEWGEMCHDAKLTNIQADEIRRGCVVGCKENGQTAIAKKYGVSRRCVNLIINNKTYVDPLIDKLIGEIDGNR